MIFSELFFKLLPEDALSTKKAVWVCITLNNHPHSAFGAYISVPVTAYLVVFTVVSIAGSVAVSIADSIVVSIMSSTAVRMSSSSMNGLSV